MSKEISKLLSRALRHEPQVLNLTLGDGGWTSVDVLLRELKKGGYRLTHDDLIHIVETNDKKRFTLSDDLRRIRAAQGHSVEVDMGYVAVMPPDQLFHGTASGSLDSIFDQGLLPGGRKYVHLSANADTALQVGARHGKPVVLKIDAAQACRDGFKFYCADNGVWLVDSLPSTYLSF